jgi:hypothetical protein
MKNLSMPRSSLLMWLFLLIAQFGFSGCETIETKVPPAIQTQVGGEDSLETLRVGDRIRIIYLDIPTPPPAVEQVIPEDGKLTLHMGVAYNFAGKKRNQVEREIEGGLHSSDIGDGKVVIGSDEVGGRFEEKADLEIGLVSA